MRNFYTTKLKSFFKVFSGFIIAVPLLIAGSVYAATMYSSGSLLQPNEITSSHIRDNTIQGVDIMATSTFTFASTTSGRLTTGIFSATSTASLPATTTIGALAWHFPQTDGTANQVLVTDGGQQLSFATLSQPYITNTFTAGETINTGNYVSLGIDIYSTSTTAWSSGPLDTLSATDWQAGSWTSSSTGPISILRISYTLQKASGSNATTTIQVRSDNANKPSSTILYTNTSAYTYAGGTPTTISHTLTTPLQGATSTKYWIVVYDPTSSAVLTTGQGAGSSNPAQRSTDGGATWAAKSQDAPNGIVYQVATAGRAYQSSAATLDFRFNSPVGFATATTTIGNTVTIQNYGFISLLSGLTLGSSYYLSNTLGAIAASAGTNSLKVGQAVTTSMLATKHP